VKTECHTPALTLLMHSPGPGTEPPPLLRAAAAAAAAAAAPDRLLPSWGLSCCRAAMAMACARACACAAAGLACISSGCAPAARLPSGMRPAAPPQLPGTQPGVVPNRGGPPPAPLLSAAPR
jgi:hypothetical protein